MKAEYIESHMAGVHTAESFGRALIEQALNAAKKQLGSKDQPSVSMDAKIDVSEVTARGCINVCVTIGGVQICHHVNI
ncbi:MAG: hypothetical protein Q8L77_04080 [Nitrospirota bacterium]|nr:hypothetical protein [Nitrospirota bacterium]